MTLEKAPKWKMSTEVRRQKAIARSKLISRQRSDKMSEQMILSSGDYSLSKSWEKNLDSCYKAVDQMEDQDETRERVCKSSHKTEYKDEDIVAVSTQQKKTCRGMGPKVLTIHLTDGGVVKIDQQYDLCRDAGGCFVYGNLPCWKCGNFWKGATYSFSAEKFR